jgi:hypothetical protein
MALSSVQQGVIGQWLAAILMILGSDGQLEVAGALTDDERRDQEVHIRGLFGLALALQVKTSTYLHLYQRSVHPLLQVQFDVEVDRLVDHPLFWYLFAYLDVKGFCLGDPIFLVPSSVVHSHGYRKLKNGRWHFELQARMSPTSKDVWAPWQVLSADLGKRVVQIIREAIKNPTGPALPDDLVKTPGGLWVARRHTTAKSAYAPDAAA